MSYVCIGFLQRRDITLTNFGDEVIVGVLVDDLQLIATGPRHIETFEFAFNRSHEHLQDMGARLAPKKSVVFSTDPKVSSWMQTYKWRFVDATLTVVCDCRDLGAHLNVSALLKKTTTLTNRMQKGI